MPQREGKHYRFQKYEFYAMNGMITLIDSELAQNTSLPVDDYHWRIAPGEFMKRAIAARMHYPDLHADQTKELRDLLDNAATACKLAKAQGDPTDASTLEHVVRHQRKRQIVLPGELPLMPGRPAPLKIKANGDTAGDVLRNGCSVVPDLIIK